MCDGISKSEHMLNRLGAKITNANDKYAYAIPGKQDFLNEYRGFDGGEAVEIHKKCTTIG